MTKKTTKRVNKVDNKVDNVDKVDNKRVKEPEKEMVKSDEKRVESKELLKAYRHALDVSGSWKDICEYLNIPSDKEVIRNLSVRMNSLKKRAQKHGMEIPPLRGRSNSEETLEAMKDLFS